MMEQKLQQGIMREPNSNGGDAGENGSLQVGLLSAEVQPRLQFQLRSREWCSRGWLIFGVLMFTFSAVYLILLSGRSYNILQTAAPLSFLVVGDWGRDGLFNQTLVAKQVSLTKKMCFKMQLLHIRRKCDFGSFLSCFVTC
jgi:hypothetical protein